MIARIAKDFYWEMSHRLPFHKGPCRNIHGHSYKIRVEIEGELNGDGMLMDYYDLKQLFMPIIDKLDHCFIVDKQDELMQNFLKLNNFKYTVIQKTTTAENLSEYILSEISPTIFKQHKNVSRILIRLYETEDVFAEVEKNRF